MATVRLTGLSIVVTRAGVSRSEYAERWLDSLLVLVIVVQEVMGIVVIDVRVSSS